MKSFLPAAAVALGILLLVASAVWAMLFPPTLSWTPEKNARLVEVGNECSNIKLQLTKSAAHPSMHSGQNPAELKAKFDVLDAEYKELYQQFASATESPKTAKSFLWWAGIAFVVAGGIVVLANRDA